MPARGQDPALSHWREVQRVLSLRGGDVARNSDSTKVPTRNRNSERQVTSHQTGRLFEEWVRNAGYRGQDPALGHWREVQREFHRKGMLSPERIAVLAATSETSPSPSPFWQSLPRHLPGHRHFGSAFRDISPALAALAVTSETSQRPSPGKEGLERQITVIRQK